MIYVYAITHAGPRPAPRCRGVDQRPVHLVPFGLLAVAVSEHDSTRIEPSVEAIWRHEMAIEQLMKSFALLPARFGTTFEDKRQVTEVLEQNEKPLAAGLERVRGCVELGLRVLLRDSVTAASAPRIESCRSGTEYMLSRLEEERRRRDQRQQAGDLAEKVHAPLADLAIDSTLRILPVPELLLSAAYLVRRNRVTEFRRTVDQIAGQQPQLAALCTGHWPPYNFTPALKLPEAHA